jgi:hypothetical protein
MWENHVSQSLQGKIHEKFMTKDINMDPTYLLQWIALSLLAKHFAEILFIYL